MKKILLFTALTSFTLFLSFSLEHNLESTWEKTVDWEENKIQITINSPLSKENITLAAKRTKAERWINDNLTNIFFNNILDIPIDSRNKLSDIINSNPDTYYRLDLLGESLEVKDSVLSTNLEYLQADYSFNIYPDFVSVFYGHSQHNKLRKKLDHLDYGDFTGLIIYIPPNIPLYKKEKTGNITKVLFPKIYDEEMNLVMDLSVVEPDYMKKWGMVLYGDSFDESLYQYRIGITPLRIIAKGLFGANNSDMIISNEAANKLIGSEKNLNIISQGRILIVNGDRSEAE